MEIFQRPAQAKPPTLLTGDRRILSFVIRVQKYRMEEKGRGEGITGII